MRRVGRNCRAQAFVNHCKPNVYRTARGVGAGGGPCPSASRRSRPKQWGAVVAKKPKKPEADADAGTGAEGEAPASGRKLPSLKILIPIVAVLLLAVGGGVWFFLLKGKGDAQTEHASAPVKPAKPVAFHEMPDMTVNLAGAGGRAQYMRLKIVIEAPDTATLEAIKPVMPRITDAFQVHLREMRQSDLEGTAGIYRLREELTKRVNLAIAPARINAVLFKEIIVQ